jgi:hypothetical protein
MSSGGWSGSSNLPSHPGDSGGNTFTYTGKDSCNSSNTFCVNGSASISTSNGSNGAPNVSGGSIGFGIKFK